MTGVVTTQAVRPLYPTSGTVSSAVDDGSSPQITLLRPFFYFGRTYNSIYVNHNGHLTFTGPLSEYRSQRFPQGIRDIIAPFWTDLDNRGNGQIYYNQYTSGTVLQQATRDINQYFPGLNFNANWVFVATWYEVAYYPTSGTRTTVQAVLISGDQHSFLLMNYGIIASTTLNIQAGYDTIGSTHYYVLPGSFTSAASGSNSNFRLGSNVNEPGRWAFRTDHGSTGCTFNGKTAGYRGQLLLQPLCYISLQSCVNHNGHLTFDAPWSSYTPQLFPMYGFRDIIAPFWTDLDNRGNGQVYYNQYTSGSVLQQATQDINQYFPGLNFNANWVFVATWYQVAYYPLTGTVNHLLLNYAINMNPVYSPFFHPWIILTKCNRRVLKFPSQQQCQCARSLGLQDGPWIKRLYFQW
uniref:NIDO domain-containing protein n=1 Tax=Oreochromis niloticus TaxID=8128 RepID=A0A669DMU4_ORENI